MATRLIRGRAGSRPTRKQWLGASKAVRSGYAQMTKAAGLSGGRSSGS